MKRLLVAFLLIPLLIGICYLSPRPWRKWVMGSIGVLLAVVLFLLSPLGLALLDRTLLTALPPDRGESVEAIVVLGRGMNFSDERVRVAAELWQNKRAPLIFTSGRRDAPDMVSRLKSLGIPSPGLSGENCSSTTIENALYTSSTLNFRGIKHILLLTDAPHLLRSFLTFRRFGFTVVPHPNPLPADISTLRHLRILIREGLGLLNYWQRGYFRPNLPAEQRPESISIDSATLQVCRVEG